MASNTNRYGLQRLAANDALSLNGYEYSTTDRDAIDRLISIGAELHHHTGIAQPSITPVAPPGLTLDNTTGALQAGVRYYYVFTLVDVFGNQSAASPESFYDVPPPVASPGSPTLTYVPTGGTLPPGNYYYQLTAFTSNNGLETLAGGASYISVAVTAATNAVIITLPALPVGATGFNIYRRSPNGNTYNYLATVNTGATPTWTDFGTITPNLLRTLPSSNSTLSTNSITISYPGTTPIVPTGYSWKIYRSTTSGSYISALVAWITGGATPPATTYKDLGLATSYGQPPEASQVVGTPPKVLLTGSAEVQGVLPVVNGGTGQSTSIQIANVNTVAASGAAQTIPDVTVDTMSVITLTAACTLTFPAAAAGKSLWIALKQDGTGSRTVTWPAAVHWPSGTAPVLTTTASRTDHFLFVCYDGATWLGSTIGLNYV